MLDASCLSLKGANMDAASGPSLKVLVCGGGIAGQAVAYWLARGGHEVVVVERF
ncbi:MAG TPA: FAD-dependent oxidoreductase, partial [Umezawaea sp.]|nr:FAD-dependent oxidoreductase [Umezawaea sp.]